MTANEYQTVQAAIVAQDRIEKLPKYEHHDRGGGPCPRSLLVTALCTCGADAANIELEEIGKLLDLKYKICFEK